jgi:hypothetical protein
MVVSVPRPFLQLVLTVSLCACLAGLGPLAPIARAQTDLDAFMRQVLASRDANWKKLQQYVLDERELIELTGPGRVPLWGERHEYTWFIREGFFVRSPVKFNGVEIGEAERRKSEADYLRRAKERDKRGNRRDADAAGSAPPAQAAEPVLEPALPENLDAVIRQTREPAFIRSAYFLRFKFEEGKYALVGRETLDGRELLRIEHYPARMFGGTDRRRRRAEPSAEEKARDAQFQQLMNKVSLVTLWVEPNAHQIVKYTFDNVSFDFLPAQWLVRVDSLKASMTMGQPFPGVWLPDNLDMLLSGTLAAGQVDLRYRINYLDYRQPDVTSKVGIKPQ